MPSRKLSGTAVCNDYPKPRVITIRGVKVTQPVQSHVWWRYMTAIKSGKA